jgi:hypothetical protein
LRFSPAANERSALENIKPITKRGIMRRVSVIISKLASNFKETNKKSIIEQRSEKLLKDLENHQRIHIQY